eukprot:2280924-Amphidinium_carterae.2
MPCDFRISRYDLSIIKFGGGVQGSSQLPRIVPKRSARPPAAVGTSCLFAISLQPSTSALD